MALYGLNVTLHLLAAILWLGGMLFLAAVGAPVLREIDDPRLRATLFRRLGEKFRPVGWGAISVLLVTGVGNLHFSGLLNGTVLGNPSFWGSRYGTALAWKLGAVVLMLALQALHDFVYGPRASRLEPGSEETARYRRRASWLGRLNAVLALILIVAAVRLTRGG